LKIGELPTRRGNFLPRIWWECSYKL